MDGIPLSGQNSRLPAVAGCPTGARSFEVGNSVEKPKLKLILASRSAARSSLLAGAGLEFDTRVSQIDERAIEAGLGSATPEEIAINLSRAKAEAVSRRAPGAFVIGADQTLSIDGDLLHKPQSREAAAAQLDHLAGRTHHLVSAVALAHKGQCVWTHADSADLSMRPFTSAERDRVLDLEGQAALDSVGGYRLEGPSVRLFDRISGDYFTILGLPLLALLASLRQHAPQLFE